MMLCAGRLVRKRFATARIAGASGGGSMQREAHLGYRQRGVDYDARLTSKRNGLTLTCLGTRRNEASHCRRGELSQGWPMVVHVFAVYLSGATEPT